MKPKAAATLILSACAFMSSSSMAADKDLAGQLSASDRSFLISAARDSMAEMKMSELAVARASNEQVKEFANMVKTDHSGTSQRLTEIATNKGVQVPTELAANQETQIKKLEKLSGSAFDKAYMQYIVKDHAEDVANFQKHAKSAKDNDVKQFASNTLPTLEQHLKSAKDIQGTLMK